MLVLLVVLLVWELSGDGWRGDDSTEREVGMLMLSGELVRRWFFESTIQCYSIWFGSSVGLVKQGRTLAVKHEGARDHRRHTSTLQESAIQVASDATLHIVLRKKHDEK